MTDNTETRHTVSESADKIVLKADVKRGTGTRDQDKINVKVKGDGPEETAERLAQTLAALEAEGVAQTLRGTQPKHFVDQIQGVPTINRKGYAVLAEHFNVSVTAEPITLPSETDFEYAEFRAVATTEDGQEYSGFGSAHINRQDGDDPHLLAELAETRAMKRATAWATGVGITAYTEMSNSL